MSAFRGNDKAALVISLLILASTTAGTSVIFSADDNVTASSRKNGRRVGHTLINSYLPPSEPRAFPKPTMHAGMLPFGHIESEISLQADALSMQSITIKAPTVVAPKPISQSPRKKPPVVKLSSSEIKARQRLAKWLGGENVLLEKEADMSAARSAAMAALKDRDIALDEVSTIGIIDYTKPSYLRRMIIYEPLTGEESQHLVSHGVNTGTLYATKFSNRLGSHQSSEGLFWVGNHYWGKHGKSIRLHGMDEGVNDQAFRRAIVIHSAWYVSYGSMMKNLSKSSQPRIGRSHGCPAVHRSEIGLVLNKLQEGSFLYIYSGK